MEELKRLRAEQVRQERAIVAQAARAAQEQIQQVRAEAAQRRAQVRAAMRSVADRGIS